MVAARKRENQNRINYKIYLFFYGKKILQYMLTHISPASLFLGPMQTLFNAASDQALHCLLKRK